MLLRLALVMWEFIKQGLKLIFSYLVEGSRISSKYRLRLVAMLSTVFLCFFYALVQIIKAKEFEPLLLEFDQSS